MNGRDLGEHVDQFGVSGYTYRNTFIIFDRRTESLWYPLDNMQWTAISGERKGETIPFIEEPGVLPLRQWLQQYPESVVLLGDQRDWPT